MCFVAPIEIGSVRFPPLFPLGGVIGGNVLFREQMENVKGAAAHDGAVVSEQGQGEIYRSRIAIELKKFHSH